MTGDEPRRQAGRRLSAGGRVRGRRDDHPPHPEAPRCAGRRALIIAVALIALIALAAGAQHLRLSAGGTDAPLPLTRDSALRIATHNVHYIDLRSDAGPWSVTGWEARQNALDAAFKSLGADAVAFQEMESFAGGSASRDNLALEFLLARNPSYAVAATADPAVFPSTQPIIYRRGRLEVLDQGWFFFSTTPEVLYARGFDSAPPSFASWAAFRDRATGVDFTLVNVHFDYGSWENRRRSAELVATFVAERIAKGETILLAGDLNARRGSVTVEMLQAAGLSFVRVPGATFHLNRGLNLLRAIDHLAHGPGAATLGPPYVLRQRFGGAWPSDHYPVTADFALE